MIHIRLSSGFDYLICYFRNIDINVLLALFLSGAAVTLLALSLITYCGSSSLSHIFFIGSGGVLSSYIWALRYLFNAPKVLRQSHRSNKSGLFRVPQLDRWVIIATSKKYIEEIASAPNDTLSFIAAVSEILQTDYTFQLKIGEHLYPIIRNRLTRSLRKLYPEIRDEISQACSDNISISCEEWMKIRPMDAMLQIVSRASNRAFIGLPKCRDPEYNKLCIRYPTDIMIASSIIHCFPKPLKWLAAMLFNGGTRTTRRVYRHIKPIIMERLRNPDNGPDDLLTWFMEEHPGEDAAWEVTKHVMFINFSAIHTTSITLTHALFHLAARPEYIGIIREEVDELVKEEGWTMHSISNMRKLDSFLKESQRMNGVGAVSLFRKAIRPFTLTDGTRIPVGSMVFGGSYLVHFDENIYENASSFNGLRFYNKGPDASNQMISPSLEYLTFGYGKLACPGRFFAASEMKTIMAHIIYNYDVKLKTDGSRPADHWLGTACIPNLTEPILFKKRFPE